MSATASREDAAAAALLSIGQVLARLMPEFPKLSASKLRFLEVQGIVTPSRTESGYRKFSPEDVERLRVALTLQRDHYLPISVIRDYLGDLDAGRNPAHPGQSHEPPPTIIPAGRRYRRADLLSTTGAAPQLLNDAISTGLIAPAESFGEETVSMLRALVALERHGIEPRHLRAMRASAERDVALIESSLATLLRRPDAGSRAKANELAPELARRLDDMRQAFVALALARLMQ
ncbi:MAG: MerR family transcriptional regulator [Microthrixaceae bacterium]|nr:MerR family transcriptional regulator [Microthrixaceae bacterium]